jgi:hypothetical protein
MCVRTRAHMSMCVRKGVFGWSCVLGLLRQARQTHQCDCVDELILNACRETRRRAPRVQRRLEGMGPECT